MAKRGEPLTSAEMAALKKMATRSTPTFEPSPGTLSRATNSQLQELDDVVRSAWKTVQGDGSAGRLDRWKKALSSAALRDSSSAVADSLRINRDPKTRTPFDAPPKGATDARLRPERKPKSRPTHAAKPKSKSPAKALAAITSEAKGIARDTADINTRAAFDAQNSGRSGVKAAGKKSMSSGIKAKSPGLSKSEMDAMRRIVTQSDSTGATVPTDTARRNLGRATNAQLIDLDYAAHAKWADAGTGGAKADRIQAWRHAVQDAARAQTDERIQAWRHAVNESTQAAAQKGRGKPRLKDAAVKALKAEANAAINRIDKRIDNARASLSIGKPTPEDVRRTDALVSKLTSDRVALQKGKATRAAKPQTVKELKAAAKAAGLKGYSKLNKAGLLKALGKGAKVLAPAIAVGAGVMALTRGASVAEAATVSVKTGADMMTGGALSNREAAKARGVSETASTIGGIMKGIGSLATFGLADLAVWGVSSRKTMKAPNVRAASAKQQKIYAAKAKREQKMAVRQPIAAGKATMPDGMVSAHARRQNGRTVKIAARRMTSKEIAARQR